MAAMRPALQQFLTNGAIALMLVLSNLFFATCVTGYWRPVT
jgi:hypothetical protein